MGRTHWDEMMSRLYNPDVTYFHVDEVLRSQFYASEPVPIVEKRVLNVVSTLSSTVYKGIDVLLKTAKQVQQLTSVEIKWMVAGIDSSDKLLHHFERKEGINHRSVGIECIGRKTPEELRKLLSDSDVFVHPSYIDNSPNSVCEAQMIGLPVVACDVGGLSTLIKHEETGLLTPSNGVFELVHYLRRLFNEKELRSRLGASAREAAMQRHDKDTIADSLVGAYRDILRLDSCNK
jgi:glycosyltransferase involved in cell wall biosynthesis